MRKGLIFLFSYFMFSCGLADDETAIVLAKYQLRDGATLVLQKKEGSYLGATTPNVTWINRKEVNGKEQQVGKIKQYLDGGTINFEPVNDSLVNVRYVDSTWHTTLMYSVNVNQRIYPNDGSPYLEAK